MLNKHLDNIVLTVLLALTGVMILISQVHG